MNRPILSDAQSPQQTVETPPSPALSVEPKPQAVTLTSSTPQDVLAGALPEWDLVPLAQFVKRVKRSETTSGT